jgi:hypothetical protein
MVVLLCYSKGVRGRDDRDFRRLGSRRFESVGFKEDRSNATAAHTVVEEKRR